jgi:hypothetical protein
MLFSLCIFVVCLFWAKKTHRHSIILNFIMQSYNTMWDYQLVIIIYMVHGNDLFLWFVFESRVLFHPIIKGKKEEMNNSCWAEIKPNDNFHPNSLQPFQHKCFRVCSSAHTVNFLCIVVADTNPELAGDQVGRDSPWDAVKWKFDYLLHLKIFVVLIFYTNFDHSFY